MTLHTNKKELTFVLDSERKYLIYLTPELLTFLFKAIRFNINRFSFDNDKKCLKCWMSNLDKEDRYKFGIT